MVQPVLLLLAFLVPVIGTTDTVWPMVCLHMSGHV